MADSIINPPVNPVQPGAYSAVDASALSNVGAILRRPVVGIVGTALGGGWKTPLTFRGPGQAKQVLRGGPLYDSMRLAFAGGASEVVACRVGNSVARSTKTLAGATGNPITLTSKDYGTWCNSIKVTVAASNAITITYVDAWGNTFTETWGTALATVADIAAAINGTLPGYQGSQFVTAATDTGTLPLNTASISAMSGGSDGTSPVSQDWADGLTALETEEIDLLVPASSDASVHAQFVTHANNMSTSLARKERVVIAGGASGETAAQAITRAVNLRDKRFQLVYPGIYDYNDAGQNVLWAPSYAAAKLAGLHAAQTDEAVALTHKPFPVLGTEVKLSGVQGGALDQLLLAGVTPIADAPGGGWWLTDSLSTYQTDDVFRDIHKIRSADVVARRSRILLERQFVGGKSLSGSQSAIQAAASSILEDLQNEQIIRAYNTPVVTAGQTPKTYNVSLPVMLVDTVKFIYINVALQPVAPITDGLASAAPDALV